MPSKNYETSLEESLERVKNPVVEPNNSKDRFAGSTATFQAVYSFDRRNESAKSRSRQNSRGPDARSGWNTASIERFNASSLNAGLSTRKRSR